MTTPVLRVARPSDDLDGLLRFYRDGLGLVLLYRFEDHAGFDGIMLGREGGPYHFAFTKKRGHRAGCAPTLDNLLVFYHPDAADWGAAVQRMRDAGFAPVPSFNPYLGSAGRDLRGPRRLLRRVAKLFLGTLLARSSLRRFARQLACAMI